MCLLSRALEEQGVASVMVTWRDAIVRMLKPPRAVTTKLPRGAALGAPNDPAQQRRVLEGTLALLEQPAPLDPVRMDESIAE